MRAFSFSNNGEGSIFVAIMFSFVSQQVPLRNYLPSDFELSGPLNRWEISEGESETIIRQSW